MPTVMGDMQSIMRPRRMVRFLSRVCCPLVHKLSDLSRSGGATLYRIGCLSQLLRGCKALRSRKEQASKGL